MRTNWIGNTGLQERILRADPQSGLIVQAIAVNRSDYKQTKSAWSGADSTTGLIIHDDRVRLSPSSASLISSTSRDGFWTALDRRVGAFNAAKVVFGGTDAADLEIYSIAAYVDPNIASAGQEVAWWVCTVYAKYDLDPTHFQLVKIGTPRAVTSPAVAGVITFDFYNRPQKMRPIQDSAGLSASPAIYIEITPWKSDGTQAAHAGWARNSGTPSVTSGGKTLTGVTLTPQDASEGTVEGWTEAADVTPYLTLNLSNMSPAVLGWTGSNKLDLGGVPTGIVEFCAEGSAPAGTALTFQVDGDAVSVTSITRAVNTATVTTTTPHGYSTGDEVIVAGANQAEYNGTFSITVTGASTFTYTVSGSPATPATGTITVAKWITYTDGQVTADSSLAGTNIATKLTGVTKRQAYRMRVKLTPDATGAVSPDVFRLGVAEIAVTNFTGQITLEGGRQWVDPTTFRGETSQATIRFIRDGAALDYRDAISDLLAGHNLIDILFRVLVGDDGLARGNWMLKNVYRVDEVASLGASIELTVLSVAAELHQALPPYVPDDTGTTALTLTRSGNVVTATVAGGSGYLPEGVVSGQRVLIAGATEPEYNGTYVITVLGTTTPASQFTYVIAGTPSTPATGSPVFQLEASRVAVSYEQQALKTVLEDIIDVKVALPARYRGPLVESDLGNVTKLITNSDAKTEVDALAFIAGGGIIASQGRLQFRRLVNDIVGTDTGQPIVAIFPKEEIQVGRVSPGYQDRIVEKFCRYGYVFSADPSGSDEIYFGDARGYDQLATLALGRARLGADQDYYIGEAIEKWLPAELIVSLTRSGTTATATCQQNHHLATGQTVLIKGASRNAYWYNGIKSITVTGDDEFTFPIDASAPATASADASGIRFTPFAHILAQRVVNTRCQGLMLIPFQSTYAHHELEVGDGVAVQIDGLVMRDAKGSNRVIRGMQWATGPIVDVRDETGRNFVVWIQSLDNLLAGADAAKRIGYATPVVQEVVLTGDEGADGVVSGQVRTAFAGSVRWAASTSDYPDRATTEAGTLVVCNSNGLADLGSITTLANGQTVYVSVIAYEESDGSGAASVVMGQRKGRRIATINKTVRYDHPSFTDKLSAAIGQVDRSTSDAYVQLSAGKSTAVLRYTLPLPIGVTIVAIRQNAYVDKTSITLAACQVLLQRVPDNGGAPTTLATAEINTNAPISDTNGWHTRAAALSEVTASGYSYPVRVNMDLVGSGGSFVDQVRFAWIEIDTTVPGYLEVL